jgi:hypothetical protein
MDFLHCSSVKAFTLHSCNERWIAYRRRIVPSGGSTLGWVPASRLGGPDEQAAMITMRNAEAVSGLSMVLGIIGPLADHSCSLQAARARSIRIGADTYENQADAAPAGRTPRSAAARRLEPPGRCCKGSMRGVTQCWLGWSMVLRPTWDRAASLRFERYISPVRAFVAQ